MGKTVSEIHIRDTRANQPAASSSNNGFIYCVTDESNILERSNGSSWQSYSPSAASGFISDTAYDATSWNAVTTIAPSKNAVRDKIETITGGETAALVSDTAYDATSWNGVTTIAPSKNAVRDKIEALNAAFISDTAYASSWNGVVDVAPSKNAVYDRVETISVLSITMIIDGGGAAITTGIKGDLEIPFACTINRVTMLADQNGDIVVDIWKDTYANFPPTDADSITASATPSILQSPDTNKSQDSTLTGWTTSIAAGDILRFNVDSNTFVQRLTLSLKVTKT